EVRMAPSNAVLRQRLTPVGHFLASQQSPAPAREIVNLRPMPHIAGMSDTAKPLLSADPAAMTARAREVIRLNVEALQALEAGFRDGFGRACEIILSRPGYVVVTGMGKSGHIGGKIAATLASTGTDA